MSDARAEERTARLRETFEALSEQVLALQHQIAGLHRQLASGLDVDAEAAIEALRAERDAKLHEWALLALRWQLSGGRVSLIMPFVSTPPQAPVEQTVDSISEDGGDSSSHHLSESLEPSMLESVVVGRSNWSNDGLIEPDFSVDTLQEIVLKLGPPRDGLSHDELLAESATLDVELNRIHRWAQFPRSIQRTLLGLVACRMRRLQDDTPSAVRVVLELQLRRGFARLTQFSSEYQPGWITGLSRSHKPESGSWLKDAEYWWNVLQRELVTLTPEAPGRVQNPEISLNELRRIVEQPQVNASQIRQATARALTAGVSPDDPRLLRLVGPHVDTLGGEKVFKRVRKAVRDQADPSADDDYADAADEPIPADWPFFDRTRDRVAVMVGGEVREARRQLIEEALAFKSLDWISGYEVRSVQSLAERIANGKVEFVLLLGRFINHKITDVLLPACNASGVDWVMVRQGYGINQIRMAIERYLGDRGEDATI